MSQEKRVAVVVDSAASLPADAGRHSLPVVVPMQLNIGGAAYADGRDMTPTEFYRVQREAEELPTTASPSPGAFVEAFRSAAAQAESVLCLTVSPRFSSTLDSARTAVEEVRRALPDTRIALVDSESAAGGEGLLATVACRAADRGASLDEVVAEVRSVVPRVFLVAYLDTLYYVWRSGRIPRIAYAGSSVLGIKPVFEMHRGAVRSVARPRGAGRAERRLIEEMRRRAGSRPLHAAVIHADASEAAEQLRHRVEAEFSCAELYVGEFSPVMGAHTGPGLLGVAFWSDWSEG